MIVIIAPGIEESSITPLVRWLNVRGIEVNVMQGVHQLTLGLVGDMTTIDIDMLRAMDMVEDVKRVQEPYKKANRKFHNFDTAIEVRGARVGGKGDFLIAAGPCSVESEEQIIGIAKSVKAAGATMLRGGAFKPRTSPYAFQGLHGDGIKLLLAAREETGLPIVTEIMDLSQLHHFVDVDVVQVGARNMQNFELLKELGKCDKPILLKRGLSNTLEEWLMSAEYIMAGGNDKVILCERGIRTFESYTRNTLDLSAIPAIRALSHLPIVIDPSHATGRYTMVEPMSRAAVAAGAHGLIIEVHNDPANALCDGAQSLKPAAFEKLTKKIAAIRAVTEAEDA